MVGAAGVQPQELERHPSAAEAVEAYGLQDEQGAYRGPQAGAAQQQLARAHVARTFLSADAGALVCQHTQGVSSTCPWYDIDTSMQRRASVEQLVFDCLVGALCLPAGATACVALVRGNQLCVASVGDSR